MKTSIWMPSAAILLTLATGSLAGADKNAAFFGALHGHEDDVLVGTPPQQILVAGKVAGIASHLGRFEMTYNVTVSLPAASATGFAELTAANGDMLHCTVVGQGTPVPGSATLNQIVETHTITGGTGRFAGASGSYTIERLVDLATGDTSGSFRGMIITPRGKD